MRAGPLLSPALSPAIAPNTSATHARVRAATPGELVVDATGGMEKSQRRVLASILKIKPFGKDPKVA